MNNLEIWMIAISLAMDCLAVSITNGIILKRIKWSTMLFTALSFGSFQAIMPFLGWLGASTFSHLIKNIDHWIAFTLLLFLGGKMIVEGLKKGNCKHDYNPSNPTVIFALSVATSIDALAVGITFAFLGMGTIAPILSPIFAIGFTSFILSLFGLLFGIYFGCRHNLRMELWGGIILIMIGTKILIEHLFFN